MATTALKGTPIQTNAELPAIGSDAPDFVLVATDMSEKNLASFAGKKKILSINPSYDTPVCQAATRTFNERAAGLDDVVVLMVSADLPFAAERFCAAEGLEGVVPGSAVRGSVQQDKGVELGDGPHNGVSAPANEGGGGVVAVLFLLVRAAPPSALTRFAAAEGIEGVVPVSTFRGSFLQDYGVELVDGPLKGVSARAIVVVDENDKVVYTELVPEIAQEPDYDAALAAAH